MRCLSLQALTASTVLDLKPSAMEMAAAATIVESSIPNTASKVYFLLNSTTDREQRSKFSKSRSK